MYRINYFEIIDHGDPSVGISEARFKLEGPFYFDDWDEMDFFAERQKTFFDSTYSHLHSPVDIQNSLEICKRELQHLEPHHKKAADKLKEVQDDYDAMVQGAGPFDLEMYTKLLELTEDFVELNSYYVELKKKIAEQGEQ